MLNLRNKNYNKKISYVLSNTVSVQSCCNRPYWILLFDVESQYNSTVVSCSQFADEACIQCSDVQARQVQCSEIWQREKLAHNAKTLKFSCRARAQSTSVFCQKTNSALKITSATSAPNLVKIGLKLRPLSLTKEKKFVIPEVDRRACTLIKFVLAIHGTVRAPFIWEPTFQIWWRSVKNWGR